MDSFALLEVFFGKYGYIAVFVVLLLCGLGVPIPEDITLVTGGVMAGLGNADVRLMVAVSLAGVLMGDGIMFAAGRIWGPRILKLRTVARVMTPRRYARVQEKFDKYGIWVLFVARFLPGLRMPIYISAGISHKVSYWRFFAMDGLAACLSVPVWVYLGYYSAENINWLLGKVHQFQHIMIVLTVIAAVVLAYYFYRHHRRTQFFRESRPKILERRKHLENIIELVRKEKKRRNRRKYSR
ncbi:MAG: DedA family protein [Neisseriaceae bacterium]|nr:DedA family protein [Neisseriaceae bacterium]